MTKGSRSSYQLAFLVALLATRQCSGQEIGRSSAFGVGRGPRRIIDIDASSWNEIPKTVDFQRRRAMSSSVVCHSLFFRPTEATGGRQKPRYSVPTELCQGQVEFPYQMRLEDEEGTVASNTTNGTVQSLTVRQLEVTDLPVVLPMCVAEFGASKPADIWDFPWNDLKRSSIQDWWDRLTFGPLVEQAMRLKIQRRKDGDNPSNWARPDDNIVCIAQDGRVVGIVELSLQPPDAKRNPPPLPIPLWLKECMCRLHGIPPPAAWVTNLLIAEPYRGLGYSKVLMGAVEGLARRWGCDCIYLHTQADSEGGAVPQSLYRSLNYHPVIDQQSAEKYAWMGPELMNSGLNIVEGVPLLFLRKDLEGSQ